MKFTEQYNHEPCMQHRQQIHTCNSQEQEEEFVTAYNINKWSS
jgi:hypothetical protein